MSTCLKCGNGRAKIVVSRVMWEWDVGTVMRVLRCPECKRDFIQTITQENRGRHTGKTPGAALAVVSER